jgi:hypothetical protein
MYFFLFQQDNNITMVELVVRMAMKMAVMKMEKKMQVEIERVEMASSPCIICLMLTPMVVMMLDMMLTITDN